MSSSLPARSIRNPAFRLLVATWALMVQSRGEPALSVRVELDPGPRYVGESFELRLSVVASGGEPTLKPPVIEHGRMAVVETFSKPIQASAIGSKIALQKRYVFQCRVVADAPGTLEIPAIEVEAGNEIGRGRPARIQIKPVPSAGRPAEFLGGVGRFEIEAQVEPAVVRVGERVVYKIKATGPGSLGMTAGPSLARFERLSIPLEIKPGRDQTSLEPPSRTFVYEIRPLSAGAAVLPPVTAAAFDPAVKHYMTQATRGLPIRAVAAPTLDSRSVVGLDPDENPRRTGWYAIVAAALVVFAVLTGFAWTRWKPRRRVGAQAARRHAKRVSRILRTIAPLDPARPDGPPRVLMDHLGRYLAAGLGRPPGALSPDDVREGVAEITQVHELAEHAAGLALACDQWLYGSEDARPAPSEIHETARRLFEALARVRLISIRDASTSSAPRTEQLGSPRGDR